MATELSNVPLNPGNWSNAADIINENSSKINTEFIKLENATTKFKGFFTSLAQLQAAWPSPIVGDTAWVGTTYPGTVHDVVNGQWHDTTVAPSVGTVNLSEYATQDEVSNEFASVRSDLNEIEQEQIQGGVYDVSSHNDGAVFESLSALLGSANLSTLIPTSVRHGGMSIRFIQGSVPNSDNKYVEYRYMNSTLTGFTTESNWQKQGAEVTVSQNQSTEHTEIHIGDNDYPVASVEEVGLLRQVIGEPKSNLTTVSYGGVVTFEDIPLLAGRTYTVKVTSASASFLVHAYSNGDSYNDGVILNTVNQSYEFIPIYDGCLSIANGGSEVEIIFTICEAGNLKDKVGKLYNTVEGNLIAKNNVSVSAGGNKVFNDYPVKAGVTYAVKATSLASGANLRVFSDNDSWSDGSVTLVLNEIVNFTPVTDGYLKIASASAATIVSFEIHLTDCINDNVFDVDINFADDLGDGKLVLTTNGKLWTPTDASVAATSQYSDYIQVAPGEKYRLSGMCGSSVGGAGYNKEKTFNCNLWETGNSAVYPTSSGVANDIIVTIPNGVYFVRLSTKDKVNNPLKFIKTYKTIKDYVNEVNKKTEENSDEIESQKAAPIIVKKDSSNHFSVWVLNRNSGKYIIHPFIHNSYSYDMSSYGGASDLVCGDMWDPEDYKLEDGTSACISPNLNFIYKVNPTASGVGFENENLHIGMGGGVSGNHGCEVRYWTHLLADGKEIDLDNWSGDIKCNRFRFIQKSKCYAPDSSISATNSNNYPKIVDGEPVITAQHFLDATFEVDNNITWRNRLVIQREHVIFEQLHGAMLACETPKFYEVIINDEKASRNHFEMVDGNPTENVVGDSNPIWNSKRQADEAIFIGQNCCVRQRTVQDDGTKSKNTFISASVYNSSSVMSFKCYFQVARTTSHGMTNPDVFNIGDEISVTNERKIEFLN